MKTNVMNVETLEDLNNKAHRLGKNRKLEPAYVRSLPKDTICVVQMNMLHNDSEIRAEIRTGEGVNDVVWLDMEIADFNNLPYWEDGKFFSANDKELN